MSPLVRINNKIIKKKRSRILGDNIKQPLLPFIEHLLGAGYSIKGSIAVSCHIFTAVL